MARTKSSRGIKPFQLKSGNSTPYPFLGGAIKGLKNVLPGSKGNSGGGGANDMNTKIDEIHSALVGEEGGDTMMTKQAGPLYHNDHPDYMVGPSLPGRQPSRHRHFKSNINQGTPGD